MRAREALRFRQDEMRRMRAESAQKLEAERVRRGLIDTSLEHMLVALADSVDILSKQLEETEGRLKAELEQKAKVTDTLNARLNELEKTVTDAIARVDVRPMVNIPPQEKPDLSPILSAIQNMKGDPVDFSSVMEAISQIEMPVQEQKPLYWKLIHHRDSRGRITETEAIAE